MQRWAVWLLVLCLVLTGLAGCTTLSEAVDTTPGADRTHPFAGETVTVTVDGTDRERALVDGALDYWAANADEYAGFSVDFRVLDGGTTPADGAATAVYLAVSPRVDSVSGRYFADCEPTQPAAAAQDRDAATRLFTRSAALLDIPVPLSATD